MLVLLALILAGANAGEQPRPRIFADPVSLTAFRFPYSWHIPNHCGHVVMDLAAHLRLRERHKADRTKQVEIHDPVFPTWVPGGVRHFSLTANAIPAVIRRAGVAAVAQLLANRELHCAVYDFDRDPGHRPHAPPWPERGPVVAVRGRAEPGGTIFLVAHRERYSGLLIGRGVRDHQVDGLVDSFELMRPHDGVYATWRQTQCADGRVLGPRGAPLVATRAPRADSFPPGNAVEGRLVHLSGTADPADLLALARHLDGVHRGLQVFLPLEAPQRIKFEVHLARSADEFARMCRLFAHHGIQAAERQGSMQGFFSAAARATVSFTDRVERSTGTARLRLNHESVHQYLHLHGRTATGIPQWLDEGLAVLFEHVQLRDGSLRLKPPIARIIQLRLYYRQYGEPIATPESYMRMRMALHVHQYAEVHAMVHSLILGDPQGRDRLRAWWRELRDRRRSDVYATLLAGLLDDADGDRDLALRLWQRRLRRYVLDSQAKKEASITF